MLALCVTGPESCGKSTLAAALAQRLGRPLVLEQARDLMAPGVPYDESLLERLCAAQEAAEAAVAEAAASETAVAETAVAKAPVLDTDVLVIAVWWRERFAPSEHTPWPTWLAAALARRSPRHYLLCEPDLPWVPDPLRESPKDRRRLLERYRALLKGDVFSWQSVTGVGPERLNGALASLPEPLRSV
ncbi:MAG: ATP-binding protein [Pseudomonadota bacterium]